MVIGSGPIVIGQAAEFDYAGVQACRALREEGHRVVLVNSNPATIMTDPEVADAVYLEPLTVASVEQIIARERPDALLPTLGGQTGLNLAVELAEAGVLERYGVELLGTPVETIKLAEDRERFKSKMIEIGEPVPESAIVTDIEQGVAFAAEHGYPLVVRPAYTLGGTGGGIVYDEAQLRETLEAGLSASLIHQALLETSLLGWKEIEYEVLRDSAQQLHHRLQHGEHRPGRRAHRRLDRRRAVADAFATSNTRCCARRASTSSARSTCRAAATFSSRCIRDRSEYAIIEVNPRVSRSSALASKATGYPIAKISTRIALGQTLDEIPNPVTGVTKAAYEPTLDYVVVKIPRWPFDKFPLADTRLGTQMKSTGEAMGIGRTFARRADESGARARSQARDAHRRCSTSGAMPSSKRSSRARRTSGSSRSASCCGAAATRRSASPRSRPSTGSGCASSSSSSSWKNRLRIRGAIADDVRAGAESGYSTRSIATLTGNRRSTTRKAQAGVPHGRYGGRRVSGAIALLLSLARRDDEMRPTPHEAVVVVGSGPIRIGQGIEFDY